MVEAGEVGKDAEVAEVAVEEVRTVEEKGEGVLLKRVEALEMRSSATAAERKDISPPIAVTQMRSKPS
jgi:hypothetical protein